MSTIKKTTFSIVVLISGSGTNLLAMIKAIEAGTLECEIKAVVCDQAQAGGLVYAREAGIPVEIITSEEFPSREDYDTALKSCIEKYSPNLIVMAGFMRILTSGFVKYFEGKLINIHPSLLPKYPGLNTHARVIEAGDKETGSTVHFVTDKLDSGPIIAQEKIPVLPGETAESLQERVKNLEHKLYPRVIQSLVEGKV